jgi:hypothetical protein
VGSLLNPFQHFSIKLVKVLVIHSENPYIIKTLKYMLIMRSTFYYLRFSGLLILFTSLISCSKDGDEDPFSSSDASYNLNISGNENLQLTGTASFMQVIINSGDSESSGTTLTVTFEDASATGGNSMVISMNEASTSGMSEGTFQYKEDAGPDEVFFSISFYSEETTITYLITGGTVTLDRVNENRVKGSLDVQLESLSEEKFQLEIEGSFDAFGISQGWGV